MIHHSELEVYEIRQPPTSSYNFQLPHGHGGHGGHVGHSGHGGQDRTGQDKTDIQT